MGLKIFLRVDVFKPKEKKKKKILYLSLDKALMSVDIFYSSEEISQIVKLLNFNKSSKKTIVTLMITDELMINENNYLFIKDNVEVEISTVSGTFKLIINYLADNFLVISTSVCSILEQPLNAC